MLSQYLIQSYPKASVELLANAKDNEIFRNMLNKEHNLLETNAFDGIFGIDWEVERFSANEQTFEFMKNIRLMRNNTNNKLKIVLHNVESRFPYCANWKEMYRSKYK